MVVLTVIQIILYLEPYVEWLVFLRIILYSVFPWLLNEFPKKKRTPILGFLNPAGAAILSPYFA